MRAQSGIDPATELKRWREEMRYTQRQLGEACNTTDQAICNVERGRHTPSLELAVSIEDVTGIPARAWVRRSHAA